MGWIFYIAPHLIILFNSLKVSYPSSPPPLLLDVRPLLFLELPPEDLALLRDDPPLGEAEDLLLLRDDPMLEFPLLLRGEDLSILLSLRLLLRGETLERESEVLLLTERSLSCFLSE